MQHQARKSTISLVKDLRHQGSAFGRLGLLAFSSSHLLNLLGISLLSLDELVGRKPNTVVKGQQQIMAFSTLSPPS